MEQATTIGLDIAKYVFQVHGADGAGHVLFRKRITRAKLLGFLAAQTRCIVAMEACAGAHYWAREIAKLGHHVRLIAPAYVKPFIRRQKNDAADAEAICEAAQRPHLEHPSGRLHSIRPMRKHIQPEPEEFATDSPLEGDGFELSVPRDRGWSRSLSLCRTSEFHPARF